MTYCLLFDLQMLLILLLVIQLLLIKWNIMIAKDRLQVFDILVLLHYKKQI